MIDSQAIHRRRVPHWGDVDILQLPTLPPGAPMATTAQLSRVLFETAGLLSESRDSDDEQFRREVIELAVRSLQVAGTVIERRLERQSMYS